MFSLINFPVLISSHWKSIWTRPVKGISLPKMGPTDEAEK